MSQPNDIEALIERAGWVERLAHALVRDPDAAADLAQDAWVAALSHERAPSVPLGRWMAAIVRNLARDQARRAQRRDGRERELAQSRDASATDEAVAALELHGRLVAAVRELDEPYRTAIALRYFQDLAPQEIAERTNAPLRTVHTRLQRGLQRLRERLDREHGGRRAWSVALLPLAHRHDAWLGALAVKSKLKVAAVALLLLAGSLVAWRVATRTAPAEVASAAAEPTAERAEPALDGVVNNERLELAVPAVEVAPTSQRSIRGLVVDLYDRPVADVGVVFVAEGATAPLPGFTATSDERGEFTLRDPELAGTLRPASEELTAVLRPLVEREAREPLYVLAIAPRKPIAGYVVDRDGAPVADAHVSSGSPTGLRVRFERILDACEFAGLECSTDELGRFDLRDAPALEEHRLLAWHERAGSASFVLPPGDRTNLRIVLQPPAGERFVIGGTVVDGEDRPLEGAHVVLGGKHDVTNSRGHFELVMERKSTDGRLLVIREGFEPLELLAQDPSNGVDSSSFPSPLRIVLKPLDDTNRIRGALLDERGAPVADGAVQRIDGTPYDDQASVQALEDATLEALAEGTLRQDGARTNEHGEFALVALARHSYRLRAFDRHALRMVETEPIEGGTSSVRIQFTAEPTYPLVAGRAVDASGAPVPGAQVYLLRQAPSGEERRQDDIAYPESAHVETNADGRFELRGVACAVWRLAVCPPRVNRLALVDLAAERDREHLEVVLPRSCHLLVDARAAASTPRTVYCTDAAGQWIWVTQREGRRSWSTATIDLIAGRSMAVTVPDTATTLVLQDSDGTIRSIPLKLAPGELNIVRL